MPPTATSAGLPFGLDPPLSQRLSADRVYNPGSALLGPFQLYYPQWLFGTWTVTAKLTGFKAPLGERFISTGLAREVADPRYGVGSAVQYEARFYSTLPDTWANKLRVTAGQLPESAIIADRAFNAKSLMEASLGYGGVQESVYDPRGSPTRQTIVLSPSGPQGQPLGPRRLELYINNRFSESDAAGDFVCAELFRRVKLGVRQVDVADSEAIYRFHRESDDRITGSKRRAIYLQPQDELYFEAGNCAVALLDYALVLQRVDPGQDCVLTPKGVTQCVGPGG
ncbi:hypothetical protein KFL_000380040 [Klebsormidium nitens]|uniref:DUF6816 domain-containing protein n=1 Tax=Klebsormidium nitens TaxID=105231 RepID=A0A1Y1HS11_KLENI|nr:hypothetical protein KFL_000380040 [Klebsormidium nitens]|eukprot:GAQ79771.1 hypothetical protein KFL_000380040 [Klebsormidium nitens]